MTKNEHRISTCPRLRHEVEWLNECVDVVKFNTHGLVSKFLETCLKTGIRKNVKASSSYPNNEKQNEDKKGWLYNDVSGRECSSSDTVLWRGVSVLWGVQLNCLFSLHFSRFFLIVREVADAATRMAQFSLVQKLVVCSFVLNDGFWKTLALIIQCRSSSPGHGNIHAVL